MKNNNEFDLILKRLEDYDKKREALINKSRIVLKLSKQIIYGLHRGDNTVSLIKDIKIEINSMQKTKMNKEGSYKIAMQEYIEAITFKQFLDKGTLLTLKESKVTDTEYLLGIMDVSGEIFRYGMNSAIKGDYKIPEKCLLFLDNLYGELLQFSFRNSDLRRKFDSVKYDLQKLEKLVFDLKLKK